MLGGSEEFASGEIEHIFGYFVPFSGFVLVDDADEHVVLLFWPSDPLLIQDQIHKLELEELRLLVEENEGQLIPEWLGLNKMNCTIGVLLISAKYE